MKLSLGEVLIYFLNNFRKCRSVCFVLQVYFKNYFYIQINTVGLLLIAYI